MSDLAVYPSAIFNLALAVGLFVLRWRRKKANLPPPDFQAWNIVVLFSILVQVYLVVMPWYPPKKGGADVSFWYGTYIVTGIGILLLCGLYYVLWAIYLPKWKGYKLRPEIIDIGDGAQAHKIVRVPLAELQEWDAKHDAAGHKREEWEAVQVTLENKSQ